MQRLKALSFDPSKEVEALTVSLNPMNKLLISG